VALTGGERPPRIKDASTATRARKLLFTVAASVAFGFALVQDTGALLPDIRSAQSPVRRSGRPRMWPNSCAAIRGTKYPSSTASRPMYQ
jgi:hypothetical protein